MCVIEAGGVGAGGSKEGGRRKRQSDVGELRRMSATARALYLICSSIRPEDLIQLAKRNYKDILGDYKTLNHKSCNTDRKGECG